MDATQKPKKRITKKDVFWLIGICIVLIAIGYLATSVIHIENETSTLEAVRQYGPFVAIPLIIVEVVIAPLPGGVLPVALGALYGPLLGALYAWIGNVIGSLLVFWLARKFGTKLLGRFFPERNVKRFEGFVTRNKRLLWILYILSVFPIDLMTFAVGLSKIRARFFVPLVLIAYIPHLLLLTYVGDFFTGGTLEQKIAVVAGSVGVISLSAAIDRIFSKRRAE